MSGAGVELPRPDWRLIGVVVAADAGRKLRRLYVVPLATAVNGSPRLTEALATVVGTPVVVEPRRAAPAILTRSRRVGRLAAVRAARA